MSLANTTGLRVTSRLESCLGLSVSTFFDMISVVVITEVDIDFVSVLLRDRTVVGFIVVECIVDNDKIVCESAALLVGFTVFSEWIVDVVCDSAALVFTVACDVVFTLITECAVVVSPVVSDRKDVVLTKFID